MALDFVSETPDEPSRPPGGLKFVRGHGNFGSAWNHKIGFRIPNDLAEL